MIRWPTKAASPNGSTTIAMKKVKSLVCRDTDYPFVTPRFPEELSPESSTFPVAYFT
jgi:hypothetical protein